MARQANGDFGAANVLGKLIQAKRGQARKLMAEADELEKVLAREDARQLGIEQAKPAK